MNALENKVALITGGNSGIGYATAALFKKHGAKVIITGRSAAKVNQAAAELGVIGQVADSSQIADLNALSLKVAQDYGKVDILFVNAGVFHPQPVGSITEEAFDTEVNINFRGAVFTVEKFLPLLASGSSVIGLSSVVAHTAKGGLSIYNATKAALNAYFKTAANEYASRKIRFNLVSPGPIDTPIFGKAGVPAEQLEAVKERNAQIVGMQRLGTPDEVAEAVLFLASDKASFITGADLLVDGGALVKG